METMRRFSRRTFVAWVGGAGAGFYLFGRVPGLSAPAALAQVPGGSLDPTTVPKYQTPLLIPPVMPKADTIVRRGQTVDYYEISMKQFTQQILPAGLPATTVWGYGAVKSASPSGLLLHNAPSLTIEAQVNRPVRVKWINDLTDGERNYLPHLLPVDPTLHWANPPGGVQGRDERPTFMETPGPYTGPVPMVTHVHGAVGVADDSDGYAEAWYLPAAKNIPPGYARNGTWFRFFAAKAAGSYGVGWGPGFATFQYPNENRASTIWYHDHALGMTRLNVYAGPAGFYLIRGGPAGDDAVVDSRSGTHAVLPGPHRRRTIRSRPTRRTGRSRSRSRIARSTPTVRSSIRTRGCSSTGSCTTTSRRGSSRRSGTRSSSATRSWSTATPGRSRLWSGAVTGSGSSTAASPVFSSLTSAAFRGWRCGRSGTRAVFSPPR